MFADVTFSDAQLLSWVAVIVSALATCIGSIFWLLMGAKDAQMAVSLKLKDEEIGVLSERLRAVIALRDHYMKRCEELETPDHPE